jgi:hypothetical protein
MTNTIQLSTGSFDQDNTFVVEVSNARRTTRMTVSLLCGYKAKADGVYWGLQKSACLKSHYTEKDRDEQQRLAASAPIRAGDLVEIDGNSYRARVLGNFSDCVIFDRTI